MISPEKRKRDILRTIELNPTNIIIKNNEKVEKDGAFEEIETLKEYIIKSNQKLKYQVTPKVHHIYLESMVCSWIIQ